MKIGDLVRYIPEPSATFKWEKYRGVANRTAPGIVLEKMQHSLSHTRRYKIRWHTGIITEEWITYLEKYEDETG